MHEASTCVALNAQEGWHPWETGAIRSLTSSGERFLRPWLENTQYEKAQRSRLSTQLLLLSNSPIPSANLSPNLEQGKVGKRRVLKK